MSIEDNKNENASPEVQVSTPAPSTTTAAPADKGETVPSYRLKEESDRRRAAEIKVATFEKKEQELKDKELSATEKLTKVTVEFEAFKTNAAHQVIKTDFISQAVELGFPSKIAKLGAPDNLTEDNMKDSLKSFTKEFSEFLAKSPEAPKTPQSPFATKQPDNNVKAPLPAYPGQITGADAITSLIENGK